MAADEGLADDAAILGEQAAYYRARAGEYDEWWWREGRYDPTAVRRRRRALDGTGARRPSGGEAGA